RQLARLVGDDDGKRVTHKDGCWVPGVGFWVLGFGFLPAPKTQHPAPTLQTPSLWTIMARELAPAGTMGKTFSSLETRTSMTATPGGLRPAASAPASSSGPVARKAAAP